MPPGGKIFNELVPRTGEIANNTKELEQTVATRRKISGFNLDSFSTVSYRKSLCSGFIKNRDPELQLTDEKTFGNRKFVLLLISLIIIILVDTSVVKVNDLVDKYFIPVPSKLILFSITCTLCLFLQFNIIRYVQRLFKTEQTFKSLRRRPFQLISLTSLCALGALLGILILQQIYSGYYNTLVSILIIVVSYGIGASFIMWLALLFLSWYRSRHELIILLYFISMLIISFNLIVTGGWASAKLSPPHLIGEYVGSSGEASAGRFSLLDYVYRVSSFMSFFSVWVTTAILMSKYREKLIGTIIYWIMLSVPLVYFVITYFYQYFVGSVLTSYMANDPVTVSIILGAFLSLSKPIGGLIFGIAFWKIATIVSYEKRIRTCMIISGWGIFLIFASNQAATQVISPYPPFGLATMTVLNIAAYLMLIGIYGSATLVSVNTNLRRTIHRHAFESNLLNLIGHAEFEREIQRTVGKIIEDQQISEINRENETELDEAELRRYLDIVLKETKKDPAE